MYHLAKSQITCNMASEQRVGKREELEEEKMQGEICFVPQINYIPSYEVPSIVKLMEAESRPVGTTGCGDGGWGDKEFVINRYRVSFWEDDKVLELGGGDGCTTMRMYLMPLDCTLKNSYNDKF